MLLYPFIEDVRGGQAIFNVFGIAVLVVATRMVHRTPGHAWISASIAGPVMVLLALQTMFGMAGLLPWSAALEAAFYFYAAAGLVAYMMEDRRATRTNCYLAAVVARLIGFTLQPGKP
jgi:hypothetical protein